MPQSTYKSCFLNMTFAFNAAMRIDKDSDHWKVIATIDAIDDVCESFIDDMTRYSSSLTSVINNLSKLTAIFDSHNFPKQREVARAALATIPAKMYDLALPR